MYTGSSLSALTCVLPAALMFCLTVGLDAVWAAQSEQECVGCGVGDPEVTASLVHCAALHLLLNFSNSHFSYL